MKKYKTVSDFFNEPVPYYYRIKVQLQIWILNFQHYIRITAEKTSSKLHKILDILSQG